MANDSQELETVVVARQPIFDAGWDVIAYELLYRPISESADPVGPEAKTAGVLATTFSELGLDLLVGGRPAHINVTREFLLDVRPLPLDPRRTVLELVEDQVVDAALVEVLGEAVDAGFRLALDDFRYAPKMEPVLDLATIVKLDVRALTRAELEAEVRKLAPRREGPEGSVLRATLAFERGDFDDAAAHARPEVLADAYRQAIVWSDQFAPATA